MLEIALGNKTSAPCAYQTVCTAILHGLAAFYPYSDAAGILLYNKEKPACQSS